jgi:hypothetical protein
MWYGVINGENINGWRRVTCRRKHRWRNQLAENGINRRRRRKQRSAAYRQRRNIGSEKAGGEAVSARKWRIMKAISAENQLIAKENNENNNNGINQWRNNQYRKWRRRNIEMASKIIEISIMAKIMALMNEIMRKKMKGVASSAKIMA